MSRKFADWRVYTFHEGRWKRVRHRNDIHKFARTATWDGVIALVEEKYAPTSRQQLEEVLEIGQADYWQTCPRLIEGRRPADPAWTIQKVAVRGIDALGGPRDVAGAIFGMTTIGRRAARALEEVRKWPETSQASTLAFLAGARATLPDSEMSSLVDTVASYPCPVPVALQQAAPFAFDFLEQYDTRTRLRLLVDLWKTSTDTAVSETVRIINERLASRSDTARTQAAATWEEVLTGNRRSALRALRNFEEALIPLDPQTWTEAAEMRGPLRSWLALHPAAPDGRLLREHTGVFSLPPPGSPASDGLLDDIETWLADNPIEHQTTVESLASRAALTLRLAERRPERTALFAQAATRTLRRLKFESKHGHWWASETFRMAADRDIQLAREDVVRIWQAYLETKRSREIGELPDLCSFLARQTQAPPAIAEQVSALCRAAGLLPDWRTGEFKAQHQLSRDVATYGSSKDIQRMLDEAGTLTFAEDVLLAASSQSPEQYLRVAGLCAAMHERLDPPVGLYDPGHFEYVRRHRRRQDLFAGTRRLNALLNTEMSAADVNAELLNIKATHPNFERVGIYHLLPSLPSVPAGLAEHFASSDRDSDPVIHAWVCTRANIALTSEDLYGSTRGRVEAAQLAHQFGSLTWPESPKRWSELPDQVVRQFDKTPLDEFLEGRSIRIEGHEYTIEVLNTVARLTANRNEMQNCTLSRAGAIRRQRSVVVAIRDGNGKIVWNAELRAVYHWADGDVERTTWGVDEVNSRGNAGVPSSVSAAIAKALIGLLPRKLRE